MTKSVRHKELRKKELKRLKLKSGRKLKKSQNESKTDFKVKKLIVTEQLGDKANAQLITKSKLTLQDVLCRLSHYNRELRQDGLFGLREIIQKYSKAEIVPHLGKLFQYLSPCILDINGSVRIKAVKVIEALIIKNSSMIQPYFRTLTAHLSCAMVHLNKFVQSDSLILMDCLINHTPSLIAQSANMILDNFFCLISRKIKHQQNMTLDPMKDSYALISNPESTFATLKWKIKLLNSLHKYLEVILSEKRKIEANIPISLWQIITLGSLPTVSFQNNQLNIHSTDILADEETAKSFIQKLLPLIYQSLYEIDFFAEEEVSSGIALDLSSIHLLRCVSDIILTLWSIVELVTENNPNKCEWFMESLEKPEPQNILLGFPYYVDDTSNIEEEKRSLLQAECDHLNLNLASFSLVFRHSNKGIKIKILTLLIGLLGGGHISSQAMQNQIVSTSCSLIKEPNKVYRQLYSRLLKGGLKCYQALPFSQKSKSALLKLLLQATDYTCKHLWGLLAINHWVEATVEHALSCDYVEGLLKDLMVQFKLRKTPGFASIVANKEDLLKEKMKRKPMPTPEVLLFGKKDVR